MKQKYEHTDLTQYLDGPNGFADALRARLAEKAKQYGPTWQKRPLKNQSTRFLLWLTNRISDNRLKNVSDGDEQLGAQDWVDIAGTALINWVRTQYAVPERTENQPVYSYGVTRGADKILRVHVFKNHELIRSCPTEFTDIQTATLTGVSLVRDLTMAAAEVDFESPCG